MLSYVCYWGRKKCIRTRPSFGLCMYSGLDLWYSTEPFTSPTAFSHFKGRASLDTWDWLISECGYPQSFDLDFIKLPLHTWLLSGCIFAALSFFVHYLMVVYGRMLIAWKNCRLYLWSGGVVSNLALQTVTHWSATSHILCVLFETK